MRVCLALMHFPEFFHSLPDKQREDRELNEIIEQLERGDIVNNHKLKKGVLYVFSKSGKCKTEL